MPRSLPAAPVWHGPPDAHKFSVALRVITPLFGGGHEARQVDELAPIRAAAIRGHLRFWWRATAGAKCATAEELFEKEEEIWGSTEEPGKVALQVTVTNKGKPTDPQPRPNPQSGPQENYFLWPFNENKTERQPEVFGRRGVEFTLRVTLPNLPNDVDLEAKIREEVKQALRAWLVFGGVGSRTRRGCGALALDEDTYELLPPPGNDLAVWLNHLAGQSNNPISFTRLIGGAIVFGRPQKPKDASGKSKIVMDVWRELGTLWARLHKGHVGSVEYSPMSGGRIHDYKTLQASRGPNVQQIALVKPYWGLPINYQSFGGSYAPKIEAEDTGRMASPVIVKPVAFADGTYRPMVAVLSAPRPQKIRVQGKKLSLQLPAADPLLTDLGKINAAAKDPLAAVVVAARSVFGEAATTVVLRGTLP